VRIVKGWFGLVIVHVSFFGVSLLFPRFGFLFPNAMNTRARVYVVVNGPIRALTTICERTRDLFETWIERKVVPDRIFPAIRSSSEIRKSRLDCIIYIFE
jgi:hypothetical protein